MRFDRCCRIFLKATSVALLLFAAVDTFAQSDDIGIYLTVKRDRNCQHHLLTIDGKRFCLAPQAVVVHDDFSYITAIALDLNNRPFFNIGFTEQGARKLKNIAKGFPNAQLALVVDGVIIGFLRDIDAFRGTTLRMGGADETRLELENVHARLRAFLTVK